MTDVSFVETMITSCGTATEIAEIAARLKVHIEYLRKCVHDPYFSFGEQFTNLELAYNALRSSCMQWSGIPEEETSVEDSAIMKFYEQPN